MSRTDSSAAPPAVPGCVCKRPGVDPQPWEGAAPARCDPKAPGSKKKKRTKPWPPAESSGLRGSPVDFTVHDLPSTLPVGIVAHAEDCGADPSQSVAEHETLMA